jgi:uncharacterized protein YceK
MQKVFLILSMTVLVAGCGSLMTLPRSEMAIKSSLEEHETKCSYMPYVYSGVAYSFCRLHAEIDEGVLSPKNEGAEHPDHNYNGLGILLPAEFVLSGAIDTIALPYTVYKQSKNGSIDLE